MTASDDTRIAELTAAAIAALENGGPASVETLLDRHADDAPAVRARLEALAAAGLIVFERVDPMPHRIGPFEIIARLGSGGMGVVYRARQTSPEREVALKILRPDLFDGGAGRDRFRREVAVIAELQHPGILPVFEAGEESGVPWFTMPCIAGCTVAAVLAKLSNRPVDRLRGRDILEVVGESTPRNSADDANRSSVGEGLFTGSYIDAVAVIAARVADALEHAHQKGVIHRDVKPSNIMLTPTGGVHLLDFGIAGRSRDTSSESLTRTGTRLGTPAYMSPEQVRAGGSNSDTIDGRADVYGLGATLYEMATLRPPFAGSPDTLMRDIVESAPVRPAFLNRSISWEIETIILCAMDRDRDRRYGSAGAMRADLEAATAGRPIRGRRPGPWLRMRRFCERSPGTAVSLLLAFLLCVPTPIAFLVREKSAADSIRQALERTDKERSRAETNLDGALEVLGLLIDIASSEMRVVGLEGSRRRILETVLDHHRKFLEQRRNDPRQIEEAVAARRHVAVCLSYLGEREKSLAAHEESIECARRFLAGREENLRARVLLARALHARGNTLSFAMRHAEAQKDLAEAIELVRGRDGEEKDHARREVYATSLFECGAALSALGRRDEAVRILDLAVAESRALSLDCVEIHHRRRAAQALVQRARLSTERSSETAAGEMLDQAVSALEELVAVHPGDASNDSQLADALSARSIRFVRRGRSVEAEKDARRATELLGSLAARAPLVSAHRVSLAGSLINLASISRGLKKRNEADDFLREAQRILGALVGDDAADALVLSHSAAASIGLANSELDRGRTTDVRELLDKAEQAIAKARSTNPKSPTLNDHTLRWSLTTIRYLLTKGDHEGAVAAVDRLWANRSIDAENALGAAQDYAAAAALAARDADLDEKERDELSRRFDAKALSMIERLPELGFDDADRLRRWSGLERIREAARFRAVVEKLSSAVR